MSRVRDSPAAVDLFCGVGGLTLGLKRAGFRVSAGVEQNSEIVKTYETNHPEVKVIARDIREVTGNDIRGAARTHQINLVAGCPPCQGFSKLTDKYREDDPRNELVMEMGRIVRELEPDMVMMENVSGLTTRGKKTLDEFISELQVNGYLVNHDVLQLADYGVPQSRRRLVLLAGKGFLIELPRRTHCFGGDKGRGLKKWIDLGRTLKGRNLGRPITMSQARRNGGPPNFNWHVVRDLKEISKKRLRVLKAGDDRTALPVELRPNCHKEAERGFTNVYGRLAWNQIPPTMTTGCTTPAMGRFGHPTRLRTLSVREAALIQTFPKSYKLKTHYMDLACDLVGNALPPKFGNLAGRSCYRAWTKSGGGMT